MRQDSHNEKQQAHDLIERLAPSQVSAVVGLLQAMLDPVARAIANAPVDDEPVTPEEEKAIAESREWLKHNQGIPHEEVLAELGITQEEIAQFKERQRSGSFIARKPTADAQSGPAQSRERNPGSWVTRNFLAAFRAELPSPI